MLTFKLALLVALSLLTYTSALPSEFPRRYENASISKELIGDLLSPGVTTVVGRSIANILLGSESGQSRVFFSERRSCNSTDPCCIWYRVSDHLTRVFTTDNRTCNDNSRAAIRLGFHDAATWSKSHKAAGVDYGGADGSLILPLGEGNRSENKGLQTIVLILSSIQKQYNVGAADLVQFAANHAVATCPYGPRVRTFVGRKDATRAAPPDLLPGLHSSAGDLIELFADKTINAYDLAALVGAHTVSKAFNVNGTKPGSSQDSTPSVWDARFYNETLSRKPHSNEYQFPSDIALSNDPCIASEWRAFANDQRLWNQAYSAAYVRLSLLGVNNINDLTECSAALPIGTWYRRGKYSWPINHPGHLYKGA